MSAFVSYQSSFNTALAKFIADPNGESEETKRKQRWHVLTRFEINFNHHTKVSLVLSMILATDDHLLLLLWLCRRSLLGRSMDIHVCKPGFRHHVVCEVNETELTL